MGVIGSGIPNYEYNLQVLQRQQWRITLMRNTDRESTNSLASSYQAKEGR